MKTYSVKDIAELLGTNPETVRRWIRSGKLKAEQESRKNGNTVTENELNSFLNKMPKYATVAAKSLAVTAPVIGLPIAIGGLIGTVVAEYMNEEEMLKNAKISTKEIVSYIKAQIAIHEKNIARKKEAIRQLEDEIAEEQVQIDDLNRVINMIKQNSKGA